MTSEEVRLKDIGPMEKAVEFLVGVGLARKAFSELDHDKLDDQQVNPDLSQINNSPAGIGFKVGYVRSIEGAKGKVK